MSTITIDGETYFEEDIPNEVKFAMQLLQEAQKRQQTTMIDAQMAQFAVEGLSARVKDGIKDVKPIPKSAKEEADKDIVTDKPKGKTKAA